MKRTIYLVGLLTVFAVFTACNSESQNSNNKGNTIENAGAGKCKSDKCKSDKCKSDKCKTDKCKSDKCKADSCKSDKCKAHKCKSDRRWERKRCTKEKDRMSNRFVLLDADDDGKLSKAEFLGNMDAEYLKKDTDSNGVISSSECKMFDKFNTNKDESLSKEEFKNGHAVLFSKIDADNDGWITKEEMKTFFLLQKAKDKNKAYGKCNDGKCGNRK